MSRTTLCAQVGTHVCCFSTGLFASLFIYLPHSGTTVLGSEIKREGERETERRRRSTGKQRERVGARVESALG